MTRLLAVLLVVLCTFPAVAAADPPPNDSRQAPQLIDGLPARISGTTVDATTEPDDPFSSCGGAENSVFYEFRAGADGRIMLRLQADGDLDAAIDVFRRNRSQLESMRCAATDEEGAAAVGIDVTADTTYLVRVAERPNSESGTFTLQLDRATPAARPPGAPLPAGGRRDSVDLVLNPSDAWSVALRAGRTYRVNLDTNGACIQLALYRPGVKRFGGRAKVVRGCGGYFTFTPRPKQAGVYSLLVEAGSGGGPLPYSLMVAEAGRDDTAPGIFIRNDSRSTGELSTNRIDVVDLYRFDVKRRSTLDLGLRTSKRFDLVLLDDRGKRLECACGGRGDKSIARRIPRGRYFAAVRGRPGSAGAYTLTRLSRVITQTRIRIDGGRSSQARPGETVSVQVSLGPPVNGPVNIVIERFDPLAGWLFVSRTRVRAVAGRAVMPFTPPEVGRWRAHARYLGTRRSAPSGTRYARLLVARPLSE